MTAALGYITVVQNNDAVGVAHGRKTMGNNQNGAVFHQIINGLLHDFFRFVIERRSRFVQNQNRRIFNKRPCDSDSLLLSARNQNAALADLCIQALIECADKFVETGSFKHFFQTLFRNIGAAEQNIFSDGAAKQEVILKNNGNIATQTLQIDVADIRAVNGNRAVVHIIKARQQSRNGRFPAARITDQRNSLSGIDF